VATQNSTPTQNPKFSGFDTQKIPNSQRFWVQLCVCMDNILHNLHNYTPKIFGYWVFFWVSKPENVGFWVWVEFWVATPNTVPKPRNFLVRLDVKYQYNTDTIWDRSSDKIKH
jgi:hypothetical protein